MLNITQKDSVEVTFLLWLITLHSQLTFLQPLMAPVGHDHRVELSGTNSYSVLTSSKTTQQQKTYQLPVSITR